MRRRVSEFFGGAVWAALVVKSSDPSVGQTKSAECCAGRCRDRGKNELRSGVTAERVLDPAVAKVQDHNRQDEDDDDRNAREEYDQKEARLVGGLLFHVSELLLQIRGNLFQAIGKFFGLMIAVVHTYLDAVRPGCAGELEFEARFAHH